MFDKDHSGYINARELLTVMRAFKQDPTKAEVNALMTKLDTNGKVKFTVWNNLVLQQPVYRQNCALLCRFRKYSNLNKEKNIDIIKSRDSPRLPICFE